MAHRRDLPDLPALLRRQLGRRHRRPAGRHRASRRPRRPRRRRDLAEPVPAVAAEGCRLRRLRLLRRRPALRHAGRLRRDARRGACPRHPRRSSIWCPNHSSDQHVWFQEALSAAPGSAERARYLFREGKGKNGELPPNNWESVFGGPAWTRIVEADGTPGQWYLHLFDSSQPDFDWSNEEVREEFRRILRFWLDRGVDGFRVDVAHGLVKQDGLPDYVPPTEPARWAAASPASPTGAATACTRSTATGTASSPSTTAIAHCAPRRGCRPPSRPLCGCAPTRCTRRSTSPTSRPNGMPRPSAT